MVKCIYCAAGIGGLSNYPASAQIFVFYRYWQLRWRAGLSLTRAPQLMALTAGQLTVLRDLMLEGKGMEPSIFSSDNQIGLAHLFFFPCSKLKGAGSSAFCTGKASVVSSSNKNTWWLVWT